jgi:hypothetical protein
MMIEALAAEGLILEVSMLLIVETEAGYSELFFIADFMISMRMNSDILS